MLLVESAAHNQQMDSRLDLNSLSSGFRQSVAHVSSFIPVTQFAFLPKTRNNIPCFLVLACKVKHNSSLQSRCFLQQMNQAVQGIGLYSSFENPRIFKVILAFKRTYQCFQRTLNGITSQVYCSCPSTGTVQS